MTLLSHCMTEPHHITYTERYDNARVCAWVYEHGLRSVMRPGTLCGVQHGQLTNVAFVHLQLFPPANSSPLLTNCWFLFHRHLSHCRPSAPGSLKHTLSWSRLITA